MEFVKDKVNQASETIQGMGAQAQAKGDKGELAVKLFLIIWPTDSGFRGRQRQHRCRSQYPSHRRKGLRTRQEGPKVS
jgi:hypothetical protein